MCCSWLRAKEAGDAVEMFLTRDAVAPSALPLPDRTARRLCGRLVELGAVRELTGRDTFRLYELPDLPPELRWREWMRRIEAVLFASACPVPREDFARVVGQEVSVDQLVEDLAADLEGRAFEIAQVAGGWMFQTRAAYAPAIRAAADVGDQLLDLSEFDIAVLAAITFHQPVTRDRLKDILGQEISRDLIGTGPRSPRRGAPYIFVTTEQFLVAFGLESLHDLPDREQLEDAGVAAEVS